MINMMKKILLTTVLFLFVFQGIALAGFKVWIKPDFSHQIPFDVEKEEMVEGAITVKNQNDFTIKGRAEADVAWASIVPKDFSIPPANEINLDYTINTPNQEGTMKGAFKITEWSEDSAEGVGMAGRYSTAIPFTLQVQAVERPETTTQPVKPEPTYLLPTNFILAAILIIIACVVVLILWLSQRKQ